MSLRVYHGEDCHAGVLFQQIPHLAEGVRIHGEKVTEALRPFHDRLEACFRQLREKVEKQYGVKTLVSGAFFVVFLNIFSCQDMFRSTFFSSLSILYPSIFESCIN